MFYIETDHDKMAAPPPKITKYVAALACLFLPSAAAADPADALPPGPRQILSAIAENNPDALSQMLRVERTHEEWLEHMEGAELDLDESDTALLADYLALNVPADVPASGDIAQTIAGLPADGRELFLESCQSCHGVASYYLLEDRNQDEWMAIFDAPYHRRLLVEDNQRETFSSYAAHSMPIAAGDIPEDWRE